MAGPVADPRAGALLERYARCFGASVEPPVPVEAIAVDLLGLDSSSRERPDRLRRAAAGRAARLC